MKLFELMRVLDPDTVVWIGTDETSDEGVYFGPVDEVTCGLMRKCTVLKMYAEHFRSKFCSGISIIVEMEE